MKKEPRSRIANPEPRPRRLRLAKDRIRTLSAADLTHAVGGSCDTGSITTESTRATTIK